MLVCRGTENPSFFFFFSISLCSCLKSYCLLHAQLRVNRAQGQLRMKGQNQPHVAGKEAPVGAEELMGAGLQDQHVPTGGNEQHRGLMAEGREPTWLRPLLPFPHSLLHPDVYTRI